MVRNSAPQSRRPAARVFAGLSTAVVLALTGCGTGSAGDTGPSGHPTSAASPSRTAHTPKSEPSDVASPSGSASPESPTPTATQAAFPAGSCGPVRTKKATFTLFVASGDLSCTAAKSVMSKYWNDPSVERGGNAQVAEFDGWSCDSPTYATSRTLGLASECASSAGRILARPPEVQVLPGPQANAFDYEETSEPGTFYFTSPSGKFECKIGQNTSTVTASCEGDLPSNTPDEETADGQSSQQANTIQLIKGRPASFINYGDRTDHNYAGNQPKLPYGVVLHAHGINCVIDERTGVTCRAGSHGFTVSSRTFTLS